MKNECICGNDFLDCTCEMGPGACNTDDESCPACDG